MVLKFVKEEKKKPFSQQHEQHLWARSPEYRAMPVGERDAPQPWTPIRSPCYLAVMKLKVSWYSNLWKEKQWLHTCLRKAFLIQCTAGTHWNNQWHRLHVNSLPSNSLNIHPATRSEQDRHLCPDLPGIRKASFSPGSAMPEVTRWTTVSALGGVCSGWAAGVAPLRSTPDYLGWEQGRL